MRQWINLIEAASLNGWLSIDDTGPPGQTETDTVAPINAEKVRISTPSPGSPIARFRQDAAAIAAILPAPAAGMVRLWRGNRPGEIGINPRFTNSLEGIALPFREHYGGDISYLDVPTKDVQRYLSGGAAGAEFNLPMALAAQAHRVAVEPTQRLGE